MARAAVLAAALALLAACSGGSAASTRQPPPPDAAATVDIHDISFHPSTVTVRSGQTVAWKFDDGDIAHNVTGDTWVSPDRSSGYFTHTFTTPGHYAYRCTIHSNMAGEVDVTP